MGFENLEKKLRERGLSELDKIKSKFDSEIDAIQKENKSEAKKLGKDMMKSLERESELNCQKLLGTHKSKLNSKYSYEKMHYCNLILEQAKEKINSLEDKNKAKFLKELANDKKLLPKDSKIIVDTKYFKLVNDMPDCVQGDVGDFGLIIESSDGSVKVDNTLTTLFKTKDVSLKPKIMKALFEGLK